MGSVSPTHSSTALAAPKSTHLVGINVTHTIAPPMHNYVAQTTLSLPWTFTPVECPDVIDALALFRSPNFAGGVVTMPYKKTIMSHLDELDPLASTIGACNCVYLTPGGKLRGTNTDWRGVKGCLLGAGIEGQGKPACIIGAGGASRAAVYALWADLACPTIYIINRDDQEVRDLEADVERMATANADLSPPKIIHLQTVEQVREVKSPYYIVGTVPDFEPTTAEEENARRMLEALLAGAAGKGVLLDMCFKPRVTRQIKLAKKHGWRVVEGTEIIGHQIEEQYRLWAGRTLSAKDQEQAWRVLREAAEKSTAINF